MDSRFQHLPHPTPPTELNRRQWLLRSGSALAGFGAAGAATFACAANAANASVAKNDRILVTLELSGGNDGLNTVVPYRDDAYYHLRPTLGIPEKQLRKLDDTYGFNPGLAGFERLWKDGHMAIVHGCGYEQPSFSHFSSMAYWHTGTPGQGDAYGWFGRVADAMTQRPEPSLLINVDTTQSLAVKSRLHTPVVFDDPDDFVRRGWSQEKQLLRNVVGSQNVIDQSNPSLAFLHDVARGGQKASAWVREAWQGYRSTVDYGINPLGLDKIAACIAAGLPTRLYYTAYRNNAFDTHVQQAALHQRLLTYTADAVLAFMRDMERLGQADRIALLLFSEFGRRPRENANLGTDHGTANHMYLIGKGVRGGHYGEAPSLTQLNDTDNLQHTTDFRRVYATAIDEWLQLNASERVLKGRFPSLQVFD